MSQDLIIEQLEKRDLTRAELQEAINLSRVAINHALKQLIKYNEIEKDLSHKIPIYKLKSDSKKKRGGSPKLPPKDKH